MIRCITLLLPIALALGCRTPVQKRFFSAAELGQRVVAGPEKAGGDSLVLFKAPSNSDALEVDECTGEIGQRNLIGSYHTELKIPLIQEDEWELSLTCVKKGKTGKLNTSEWVLGWHKVTN